MANGDELGPRMLEEMEREIRSLKRDLYGDERTRSKGIFQRVDSLEGMFHEFKGAYERERVDAGYFQALNEQLEELKLNYRIMTVYLRSIAAGGGTLFVAVLVAAVIGILRFMAGA